MSRVHPNSAEPAKSSTSSTGFLSPRWQRVVVYLCLAQFVLLVAVVALRHPSYESVEPYRGAQRYSPSVREPFFLGNPGPWGNIEYVRIAIEPPDDFLLTDLKRFGPTHWVFPNRSKEQVRAFLDGCNLTAEQRTALFSTAAVWTNVEEHVAIVPGANFILGLNPEQRVRIYDELATSPLNLLQHDPYTFRDGGFDDWFKQSGVAPDTLALVRRLVYKRGDAICFSDLLEVVGQIPNPDEQKRLIKTLWRNPAVMMKLRIRPDSDVNALAAYWSRGWHVKDVGSLLESLTRVPGSITVDVAHLLPPFARRRLNSYPNPDAPDALRQPPDCFWSAMNFFRDTPDERFHDPNNWLPELRQNYTIQSQPTFGDVLLFITSEGIPIHAAVYVADDVVFTKNGSDFRQPWILMKIDDLLARYHHSEREPVRYVIHRAKKIDDQ